MDGVEKVRGVIRSLGTMETLFPAEQILQDAAIRATHDRAGRLTPAEAQRLRRPQSLGIDPSSNKRKRVSRAGQVTLLAAYAETAPTTGNATITVTAYTEAGGAVTIGTVSITVGRQAGEAVPSPATASVPAGAWIGATITTANGAADVSVDVEVRQ
jgi:hypothetical protein